MKIATTGSVDTNCTSYMYLVQSNYQKCYCLKKNYFTNNCDLLKPEVVKGVSDLK